MIKGFIFISIVILSFLSGWFLLKPRGCGASCTKKISSVGAEEFTRLASSGTAQILDIRTSSEFGEGHVLNAVNIDFYDSNKFREYLSSLDKNKPYLIYCRSGNRSRQALNIMDSMGFTDVTNLEGGILSLQSSDLQIEK